MSDVMPSSPILRPQQELTFAAAIEMIEAGLAQADVGGAGRLSRVLGAEGRAGHAVPAPAGRQPSHRR